MNRRMLPYLAVFGVRFREELQYRAAALAGLVTQVVFGFILLMVLLAFYESSDAPAPLTAAQTVAYIWLGQALLGLLPWNVDPAAMSAIRTGEVACELLRPIDTYRLWFAQSLAWRCVRTALRCGPMVLLAMFVFPRIGLARYAMPAPASLSAAGWFAAALAVMLSVAITVLMQVVMLWTVSPDGVLRIVPAFVVFLSGNLIPLPLLPAWLQPFLAVQPFRGLTDTPFRIYGGDLAGVEAIRAIAWSAGWVVVLVMIGMWGMGRGVRRLVVAGG